MVQRAGLLVGGLIAIVCIGAAAYLAFSWVHVEDSTCGALYRPDIWRDGGDYCNDLMRSRLVAIGALVVAAVASVTAGWLHHRTIHHRGAGGR